MNLRHMEVFRAVMATGGVSGAAQLLHVSQPAVSKLLAQAQRHTGFALFQRVRGRLVPTPEARQLHEEIEALWRGVERLRGVERALADPGSGSLRLAVTASVSATLVPRAVALLYQRHPYARLSVETLVPAIMTDTLLAQSSHLGVALLPNEHPNLVFERSYQCGLACVMPDGHPLAALPRVRASDLRGHRVITSPVTSAYGRALHSAYGVHADSLRLELEARSSWSACMFAAAGAGVAVVDTAVVAAALPAGLQVRPFAQSAARRARLPLHIVRNRYRPLSGLERAFCDAFDTVWKAAMA